VAGKGTAAEARFIVRPVDEEILHSNHKKLSGCYMNHFHKHLKALDFSQHFISLFYVTVRIKPSFIISDSISVVVFVMESNVVFQI